MDVQVGGHGDLRACGGMGGAARAEQALQSWDGCSFPSVCPCALAGLTSLGTVPCGCTQTARVWIRAQAGKPTKKLSSGGEEISD